MARLRNIRKRPGPYTPAVFRENAMLREKVHEMEILLQEEEYLVAQSEEAYSDQRDDYLDELERADGLQKEVEGLLERIRLMEKPEKDRMAKYQHGFLGA